MFRTERTGSSVSLGKSHQKGFPELRRLFRTISRCASVCRDSPTDRARRPDRRGEDRSRWRVKADVGEYPVFSLDRGEEIGL